MADARATDGSLTARLDEACRLANESKDSALYERCLCILGEVARAADALGVLSENDRLEEISTPSLRMLLLPSLQADIEQSVPTQPGSDRIQQRLVHLDASLGAARLFFAIVRRHKALPSVVADLLHPHMAPKDEARAIVPEERRTLKIRLFKLEKQVQARLEAFRGAYRSRSAARLGTSVVPGPSNVFYDVLYVPGESSDVDDDEDGDALIDAALNVAEISTLRAYLLLLLVLHALRTTASFETSAQELELLRMASCATPVEPEAPPADDTWRLDRTQWHVGGAGPLLSESGKPLRPFVITGSHDKRAQLQSEVFRPSHRLPTMSIDEYLAEEERRGNIIHSGSAASAAEPTPRESRAERAEMDGTRDAEIAEDEARREAIEWDAFTDEHRRGEGNRRNRG